MYYAELSPFTKINLKWIIHLSVTCRPFKHIKENVWDNLYDPYKNTGHILGENICQILIS